MTEVLTGEVQQWCDGRWRTVLTPSGQPVTDRRRRSPEQIAGDLPWAAVFRRPEETFRRPG